ncbi:integrase catalytic domain-containing protein [Nephila pilipes]|uniref:Integrase catalytic domain-containing protein n=1 Tax=Nephila pilipes TaxID=299642 RepID=A0A8X6JHW1_NEPPI|nr:integrase catalytic domain-containing protein [Nephila pilipes]
MSSDFQSLYPSTTCVMEEDRDHSIRNYCKETLTSEPPVMRRKKCREIYLPQAFRKRPSSRWRAHSLHPANSPSSGSQLSRAVHKLTGTNTIKQDLIVVNQQRSHYLFPGQENLSYPVHFVDIFSNEPTTKENLSRRILYQTKLLCQIWAKWKNNYLMQLRNAHNFVNPTPEKDLKRGDVVLIEGTP